MKCTVCQHPQRHDIDRALLAGNATFAALSQQYRLSISALFRHKKLLKLKMAEARDRLQDNLHQGCLFQFNEFLEATRQFVRTAGADGNTRQALQAVCAGTRILNFITKLDVNLDQDTVYRIMASPQWATQDSLLPTDPRIITDTHQALAHDLFFRCPEPPPALDAAAEAEENDAAAKTPEISLLETRNPEPETLLANLNLELLQKVFPSLDLTVADAQQTAPKNQREKSAKLPKKTLHGEQYNEQYHEDMPSGKKVPKKAGAVVRPACEAPGQGLRKTGNGQRPTVEKPKTDNQQLETPNSELETPPHESLFDRLRRKWAKIAHPSNYSCDSEKLYEEYLKEKNAACVHLAQPSNPDPAPANQPLENGNPQPETPNSEPEAPKPWEPLNPFTHPKEYYFALEHGYRLENRPKNIPDRRWEEDFGNPRKIKGCY